MNLSPTKAASSITSNPLQRRMPAQWEPHKATWMAWPFDADQWWQRLWDVRREYACYVRHVASGEHVFLLCADDECKNDVLNQLGDLVRKDRVSVIQFPLNDIWLRDSGGIFVRNIGLTPGDAKGNIELVKWEFNAWGEKYPYEKDNLVGHLMAKLSGVPLVCTNTVLEGGSIEVNGQGLGLTTASCLLSKMRNPQFNQEQIESLVIQNFGLHSLGWLPQGLLGDHTDGHIDTLARFVNEHTVVFNVTEQSADPNFGPMLENKRALEQWANRLPAGVRPKLIGLPLPKRPLFCKGERLPANYANFYFCNAGLLVPQFGDEHDTLVLDKLRQEVKDRPVIGVPSQFLITGGGILNCLVQQQPI